MQKCKNRILIVVGNNSKTIRDDSRPIINDSNTITNDSKTSLGIFHVQKCKSAKMIKCKIDKMIKS